MWVWILLVYSPLCEAALGEPPRVSPTSSIYFPHAGAAFLSSRDWLLITTINLDPYDQLLHQMKVEIDNFAQAVDALNDVYQETRDQDAGNSQPQNKKGKTTPDPQPLFTEELFGLAHTQTKQMGSELARLQLLYNEIRVSFLKRPDSAEESLTETLSRPTRALVPDWLSTVLGFTTGLATESQTNLLKKHIRILSEENKLIATAVHQGITLLNSTSQEVGLNRRAINHLTDAVETMRQEFGDLQSLIAGRITDRLSLALGADALLLSLSAASTLIRRTHSELIILRAQLQSAASGQYPWDLLSPEEVETFANHLRESLPHSYVLPFKTDELHLLLHTLPAVVVSNTTTVHVALRFPLSEQEEFYDIHTVAYVPYFDDTSNTTVLQYSPEAEALAITKDRSRYRLLSASEVALCAAKHVTHCPLTGPAYDTENAPLCVTSLLIQDQNNARRLCKLEPLPIPRTPIFRPIGLANWLVFSPESLHMTLACMPHVRPEGQRSARQDLCD